MTTAADLRRRKPPPTTGAPPVLRVAIYTRKSTEKGLDQAFTSIDNQREMVAAYVASQRAQGWLALDDRYDDGGFSGATTDRPAFQRLLADVEAGKVQAVAVYRLDRLSRSVIDFMHLLRFLEQHGVQFVSVTEHFDTTTPMGRFTLGILINVAQLEREVTAARIRDKMAASRRRGLWQGGRPPLGLDVVAKELVVNETEATDVRTIFETYLRLQSLVATLDGLARRGIKSKSWTTLKGKVVQGTPFDVNGLRRLLSNPLYAGKLRAGEDVVKANHTAIVEPETFEAVQALLADQRTERRHEYRPTGALLQGLLRCARCSGPMVPHYTQRGAKRFGYYLCATQKRRGTSACAGTRAPAGEVEAFVVERIKDIRKDPSLVAQAITAASAEVETRAAEREADLGHMGTEAMRLRREHEALLHVASQGGTLPPSLVARIGEAEQAAGAADERLLAARAELAGLRACAIEEADLRRALETFEIWNDLFPAERARVLHLLIERVVYDADAGKVDITFRPGGVAELAQGEAAP